MYDGMSSWLLGHFISGSVASESLLKPENIGTLARIGDSEIEVSAAAISAAEISLGPGSAPASGRH